MVDRAQVEIVFEGFESGFNFREADVKVPKIGGLCLWPIGSQQVAAFPATGHSQFGALEPVAEACRSFAHGTNGRLPEEGNPTSQQMLRS